ncbi:unnamed protein product [Rotaria sp. Silwood1]|nr:unnamed protein product [Rotaria sp. Silwood1]CAF1070485.1 unnamed protein product [Rotaria sp. Silwood1]CAF3415901.1 unnamed protein product [Rotaria sp. Silwood1]CAF4760830.1 unnamed protein product [Rotaria sp. Silwood1]CAF4845149.1 unnamed protein product [Rotaria sp. Silwood1]
MSGLFNRLKSRKSGSHHTTNNEYESIPSGPSFDEEGFLCPICHHKFNDHISLAEHYTKTHEQGSTIVDEDTTKEESNRDIAMWKQQFTASEESRIIISNELIQQKQRADDLEEELQLLQKHLKATQTKVIEQSQEIANLKATKDIYDIQLANFTHELLNTQAELKEKDHQVATLCDDLIPRSTNDDVDVLKRELITVQQRMDEISLEKEQEIEKLRFALAENYQCTEKLNKLENIFNQNLLIYDEMINKNTSQISIEINEIKQFIKLTRERKEKFQMAIKYMRNCLTENQTQIEQLKQTNIQLNNDLEQRKQFNDKLINDLQIEQKQTNSYRNQIELLTNEIHELEKTLNELQNEKNQLIQTKIDSDENNERQNFVRQITQEKDQYEQQTKELRIQIKQINNERQQIQDEFDHISKQYSQITYEKNELQHKQIQLNHEIDLLKKQLDDNNKEKKQQINELKHELSTVHEQYMNIEANFQKTNEYNDNQKQEIEQLKNDLIQQNNRFEHEKNELEEKINQHEQINNENKLQLNTIQNEKNNIEQQLQTTLSQLNIKLDQKDNYINRLLTGIRRAHKIYQHLQQNIHTNQMNLLTTIEQAEQESRLIRTQTLEQIHEEFTNYLTIVHTIITDSKIKLEKQIEIDNLKLFEQQQQTEKQLNIIKDEYDKLMKKYHEEKQKFEIQLGELNHNLLQVSESLSNANQTVDIQQEKYEKQINSLENELESRTKKYEMQLLALTENLATVRSELRITNEKLSNVHQIKSEKSDIEARLVVNQDERRVLLERSLASESKNEKLIFENNQLIKKNTDLESALQEIAREYQVLQIQTNKLNQRRWLNDDDINACMKCNQTFSVTQRKHHCRNCGNIFCDSCSSKTAIVAASSKKPQRVCDQCYKDLTS